MVQRLNKSLKSILTTAHTEKHGGHSAVIAVVKKSKRKKHQIILKSNLKISSTFCLDAKSGKKIKANLMRHTPLANLFYCQIRR